MQIVETTGKNRFEIFTERVKTDFGTLHVHMSPEEVAFSHQKRTDNTMIGRLLDQISEASNEVPVREVESGEAE